MMSAVNALGGGHPDDVLVAYLSHPDDGMRGAPLRSPRVRVFRRGQIRDVEHDPAYRRLRLTLWSGERLVIHGEPMVAEVEPDALPAASEPAPLRTLLRITGPEGMIAHLPHERIANIMGKPEANESEWGAVIFLVDGSSLQAAEPAEVLAGRLDALRAGAKL